MKWDVLSHSEMRSEWDRTEMRTNFFSWDEMRSNLCEMRAPDPMPSQNQNQNETRSWWDESFHSDFTPSQNQDQNETRSWWDESSHLSLTVSLISTQNIFLFMNKNKLLMKSALRKWKIKIRDSKTLTWKK